MPTSPHFLPRDQRPLTDRQTSVLRCMGEYGVWQANGRWSWGNNSTTARILAALAARGLVADTGRTLLGYPVYRITEAGRAALAKTED